MAPFDPYYMIARRLAKAQFEKKDLLTITTFMVEDIERLLGMSLMTEPVAQLNISSEEVYAAFEQIYGHAAIR
jgi:hypothetical protein